MRFESGMLRSVALAGLIAGSVSGVGQEVAATTVTTITVHAGQSTGKYTPDWNYFGADEPNYTYTQNGKKLLKELHDLSPVPGVLQAA